MVDVVELQDYIIANPHYIQCVLEELGHTHIRDKGKYYSARNIGGDNDSGLSVLKSTLHVESYSRGWSTSLIGLVQDEKGVKFKEALKLIAGWIGFKGSGYKKKNIKRPFGGFYTSITADDSASQIALPTYSEDILPESGALSYLWLKDGCSLQAQERYKLRLDLESNLLVIPHYSFDSSLIGAKWRRNATDCDLDKRWGMYKAFSKSRSIYGMDINYRDIQAKRTVFVFEAEKSCLQLTSGGLNLGISIGGHNISETQVRYIRSLMADRIVVAFDSDICEEEVRYEASKLKKDSLIYKPSVYYIYDNSGVIMDPKKKTSPTDMGSQVFEILSKKCLHKL